MLLIRRKTQNQTTKRRISLYLATLATPWTVALQALLSMRFLQQEYGSGLPFPSSGDLPEPEMEPMSPGAPALESECHRANWEPACTYKPIDTYVCMCVCVKSLLSRLTVCDPMGCSPPGPSVHGILRARVLEWLAISFPGGTSLPRDGVCVSCICRQILYRLSHQGSAGYVPAVR